MLNNLFYFSIRNIILTINKHNESLGGCTLEQEGEDFFIVGADSVRKKLGNGIIEFTLKQAKYDLSFDVSEYSLLEFTITTQHVYSKLDIYLDDTSIYSVGLNESKNETVSFDISGNSTLRIKGNFYHTGDETYADVQGRILNVKIS